MKLAILGGTFDPPHIGHLVLAEILHIELGYSKILFVPANIPAHKDVQSGTSPEQRLQMVRIAVSDMDAAIAEDCELRRGGTSYSIDTVRELKQRYPELEANPGLCIGDDLLGGFSRWKEYSRLVNEAEIIIARRLQEYGEPPGFPHVYMENPLLLISSTDIRNRIRSGKAYRYLVTEKIYSYIEGERIYGA